MQRSAGNIDNVMTIARKDIPPKVIDRLRRWMATGSYTEQELGIQAASLLRPYPDLVAHAATVASRLILIHSKRKDLVAASQDPDRPTLWRWATPVARIRTIDRPYAGARGQPTLPVRPSLLRPARIPGRSIIQLPSARNA